jgi:hypothetical protein
VVGLDGREVEAVDLRTRQRTCPHGHPWALLELAHTRHHALGDAAEQMARRELLAHGLDGRRGLIQVRRRKKQEREIDLGPAQRATAGLARRLRRGVPGRLRGRETSSDPARERPGFHSGTQCLA